MADNETLATGVLTGTVTVAMDEAPDLSGVKYQRIKITDATSGSIIGMTVNADGSINVDPLPSPDTKGADDATDTGTRYFMVAARGYSGAPPAVSTDGDATPLYTDRSGRLFVITTTSQDRSQAFPTITAGGNYVSGEQLGTKMSFAVGSGQDRGGVIQHMVATDRSKALKAFECWLFEANPTLATGAGAGTDSSTFDITDANLEAARLIGVVDFAAANWKSTGSNAVCVGSVNGATPYLPYLPAASDGLIYGVLVYRDTTGTPYAGANDITIAMRVVKDA